MKNLIFVWFCLILAIPCQARVITVDDDGPADFDNIQAAIDDANTGDIVEVQPGTYTGNGNQDIDFLGKAITVRSTEPNDPNIVAATIIDCNGSSSDKHRGFYFHNGEDANSILNGFTITNGYHLFGGAICCEYSSPIITNCTINANTAGSGGGIDCGYDSNPIISNCTISRNSSAIGGGIFFIDSNPTISNCNITDNITDYAGGGICAWHESSPTITNCLIENNIAEVGGGIYCECDTTISNCNIKGNTAFDEGGGINLAQELLDITNCIISGNSAVKYGGGILSEHGWLKMTNCTISGNKTEKQGGGFYNWGHDSIINNCIIWNNFAPEGAQLYNFPAPNYSCIQDWTDGGTANITSDPCFVDPGYWADACDPNIIVEPNDPNAMWIEGDYYLLPTSPCIDTGDPNFVPEPNETDLDGNPRVVDGDNDGNSVVDMGAYERIPEPAELILDLADDVMALNLHKGISNSLEAKLNAALRALEDENENNDAAAVNTLEAFINVVEAQRGKKIPEAEADALIAAAEGIIELLSDG